MTSFFITIKTKTRVERPVLTAILKLILNQSCFSLTLEIFPGRPWKLALRAPSNLHSTRLILLQEIISFQISKKIFVQSFSFNLLKISSKHKDKQTIYVLCKKIKKDLKIVMASVYAFCLSRNCVNRVSIGNLINLEPNFVLFCHQIPF